MPLQALQQQMLNAILAADENIASLPVCQQNPLSPQERIGIYRHNIRAQLIQTLKQVYPVCFQLVGEDCFNAMAAHFAMKISPPQSFSLNHYGHNFPAFIEQFEPLASVPYLADVARLEWAYEKAQYSPYAATFPHEKLAAVPTEHYQQLRFCLPQGSTLLASPFPVFTIWHHHQQKEDIPAIDIQQGGETLLISREQWDVRPTLLSQTQWQCLMAIKQGQTLSELSVSQDTTLHSLLTHLITKQWVNDIILED